MTRPLLGISLQADLHFLTLNRRLIEDEAEIFEINPETLWEAGCRPGPLHQVFAEILERSGRPAIGHGILYSLGAALPPARRDAWIAALRRDQDAFGFEWFSEHLGFADAGPDHVALPLPLPHHPESVAAVAANLEPLREVFGTVAFENNVGYFALGDPMDEPRLFAEICAATGCHLVLDLHNGFTTCTNFGLDFDAWLAAIPTDAVIEIHLSGGGETEASWLPGARPMRLDSHDSRVPDPVWDAFVRTLPRCPGLRAVILEWSPDEMDQAAAQGLADDFQRAREILC